MQINGQDLKDLPFHRVQDIFKNALSSPELRLHVIRHKTLGIIGNGDISSGGGSSNSSINSGILRGSAGSGGVIESTHRPPAPVYPRSLGRPPEEAIAMVEGEERQVSMGTKVATVSPTKKVSPTHPTPRPTTSLLTANTRKIGRKLELELEKGTHGLGFSITTRDNPAGGNCPIYIKNILPKGAAVEDGRLRPGDRLLEVNGVEMTGKTQAEAVAVLRNTPAGSKVSIVVSRQEEGGGSSPKLPRQLVAPETKLKSAAPEQNANVSVESVTESRVPQGHDISGISLSISPQEKSNDDSLLYPWKHKEILTFDIPVHDTEKAGLGVSVKGKTTANHGNNSSGSTNSSVDLGIFIKSVLHGGAASRDGRLRMNDQLLNVNGISLLGQSNSDAMETLRRAMLHTEGPIPGVITLTIARRSNSPASSTLANGYNHSHTHSGSGRESVVSQLTSSSGTETFGGKVEGDTYTPDNSGTSETSDNTVIFLPYQHKSDDSLDMGITSRKSKNQNSDSKHGPTDILSTRNPVIDRLTGQLANSHAMRNESYYRATNDTWNTTLLMSGTTSDRMTSPTIHQPSGEMVLIEEEYIPKPTINNLRKEGSGTEKMQPSKWSDKASDIKAPSEHGTESHVGDATYASQLSLEESAAGFSRDAFGRQSMSEKRHATLDAKNTDTYQRNKKLREERERQRHMQMQQQLLNERNKVERNTAEAKASQDFMVRANSVESIISLTRSQADSDRSGVRNHEFGPSLGMKKSSSLESLQTLVQELQMQDHEGAYVYHKGQGNAVRVIRGRGCNDSFRAAVDRSYEVPLAELRSRMEMETLAEEEGCVSVPVDCTAAGAHQMPFSGVRGGPRQSSLNSALDGKHKGSKKKPGLFRGIGSMFRFGRHRKLLDEAVAPNSETLSREDEVTDNEREAARRAAQEEQQRIQEQYRRLIQRQQNLESGIAQQQQQQQQQEQRQQQHHHHHHHQQQQQQIMAICRDSASSGSSTDGNGLALGASHPHCNKNSSGARGPNQTRSERIHELRARHQRRHAERCGQYPLEDREEHYEEVIRQHLDQPEPTSHTHSASYDLYGEMARPGSRVGITDPAKFSHYVNYEEIQQHLSRRQQHYHSQRRDTREPHRPVSNFYEYESIQNVMRGAHKQQGVLNTDANSNTLPRHMHQDWAHKNSSSGSGGSNHHHHHHQKVYSTVQSSSNNFHLEACGSRQKSDNGHESSSSKHNSGLILVHNLRGGNKMNNLTARPQGPFVTQVMISQQQTPGSKV